MKLRMLMILAAGLALGAQPPPPSDMRTDPEKLPSVLMAQEQRFLELWKAEDFLALKNLLADDYVEIGGTPPERLSKSQLLLNIAKARLTDYSVKDPQVVLLNADSGIVTYQLTVKGSFEGKNLPPSSYAMSSVWANRSGKWVSVFRQGAPIPAKESPSARIETFDAMLTPNGVRYQYKGKVALEEIRAKLNIVLAEGPIPYETFWSSWQHGETKEIDLGFLAFGVNAIQQIDFSATALMNGKPVECFLKSQRRDMIAFNRSLMPVLLSPFFPVP
jgi:hypothetical protein